MAGVENTSVFGGHFVRLSGSAAIPNHIPSNLLGDNFQSIEPLPLAHRPAHSPQRRELYLRFIRQPAKQKSVP
ncbi:hypothetical protein HH682_11965 [Rosenbergiella sp. S61]|uniref:Uncharacterized protein n=1 Tax=Rosenbergiella gaditana TaxID=2726987 RepID=A0ABS5T0Y8_9GAMM|nr:hypothetical protein [Rosenbergiella gaditana]MBT0725117.1 hypothetical protein [Rosenbergiella gaditana]